MKYIKQSLISLLVAMVTVIAVYGGYTIYAQESYDFESPALGYAYVSGTYHDSMNDYFNEKLAALVEILEDNEIDEDESELFKVPQTAEECTNENLSTYCVARGALDRYVSYIETLDAVRSYLPGVWESDDLTVASPITGVEQIILASEERDQLIDEEIENAKQVMEAAVAAYNEFRLAYPMHKKYEEIINNLAKYRIALQKIRYDVARFPNKFIDATSSQCE